jgi:hypothetical protein
MSAGFSDKEAEDWAKTKMGTNYDKMKSTQAKKTELNKADMQRRLAEGDKKAAEGSLDAAMGTEETLKK